MSKQSFFDSKICKSRKRCWQCRVNPSYREGIASTYDVPSVDFDCPFGVTEESIPDDQHTTPLSMMAKDVASVIVDSAVGKLHGQPIRVEKSDAEKRFDICLACPYLVNEKTCDICNCDMTVKSKFGAGHCPAKKW